MISLILFIPMLALPAFWLAPVPVALSFYALVLLGCLATYFYLSRLRRRHASTLRQLLYGRSGAVIQIAPYLRVQIEGEPWSAQSDEALRVGDRVFVHEVSGVRIQVGKKTLPASRSLPSVEADP